LDPESKKCTRSLFFLFLLLQTDPQVHGGVKLIDGEQDLLGLRNLLLEVEDAVDLDPEPKVELGNNRSEEPPAILYRYICT
jgi:hypothetical protein